MSHVLLLLRSSACVCAASPRYALSLIHSRTAAVCRSSRMHIRALRCLGHSSTLGAQQQQQQRFLSTSDYRPTSFTTTAKKQHSNGSSINSEERCGAAAEDEEEEDDLTVQLYRPQVSPADAERKVKTELFLCLLLTLPRTQDWRDMLTAAFRADTWRPHHLDAVLRGVLLNKYNEPCTFLRSCGGPSSCGTNRALREAAEQASQTAPATSTPTSRLHRARDVLIFCAEEGVLYVKQGDGAPAEGDGKGPGILSASSPSHPPGANEAATAAAELTPLPANVFAPSPSAVHHLLAMLLQAAQRGVEYASAASPCQRSSTLDMSALPTASYADVWHFLAWMELHGYHVLSHAVLDALEAAVDEDGSSLRPHSHSNATDVIATTSISASSSTQYALVSQRIHRLDYVRGERALLQESLRRQSKPGSKDSLSSSIEHGGSIHGKWHDLPRTDPEHRKVPK
ncbi:hypothetical protein N2W54_003322 [Lotmaria passim]